ncbi:MAG: hypothetical protein M1827_003104 [Pycnora praestabilis]|nr:MAG: hypothetical protein M1827_003104 [Pycnora praestabilis]
MPSGDLDHNYYTLHHRRRPSQLSDYDHQPQDPIHRIEDSSFYTKHPPVIDSIPPLPAYGYSQSPPTSPKQLSVSTDLGNFTARSNGVTGISPIQTDSSDPHEFYRKYRNPFGEESPKDTEQANILVEDQEDGMTATAPQRKPKSSSIRNDGRNLKFPPLSLRNIAKPSKRSASAPLNPAKSTPALSSSSRSQQTSLKDLVDRFNQNNDELLPLPSNMNATNRTPSSTISPVGGNPNYQRVRGPSASKATAQVRSAMDIAAGRDPLRNTTRSTPRRKPSNESPGAKESRLPNSKLGHPLSAMIGNPYASQSLTNLNPHSQEPYRRPLFGEVLNSVSGSPDPGYGIPGRRERRTSEGSMHTPNPMFPQSRRRSDAEVSPSSPSSWYLNLSPSPDDIKTNKQGQQSNRPSHRRARSDFAGIPPESARVSGLALYISSGPPPVQPVSPNMANGAMKRFSPSRIPLSTRRPSVTSDSGTSPPSTRTNSAMGDSVAQKVRPQTGPNAIPKIKKKSISPIRQRPSTPSRSIPIPRRHEISPGKHAGNSPSLKAYISAPLPKKSPPLRSSRPRLPVSSASTSASRAKIVERYGTQQGSAGPNSDYRQANDMKPRKKIPELTSVDFAARRERIQKAFTKSVAESEKRDEDEAAVRRLVRQKQGQDDLPLVQRVNEQRDQELLLGKQEAHDPGEGEEQQYDEEDDFETPLEEFIRDEPGLTLDTVNVSHSPDPNALTRDTEFDTDDSPTLGIPGSFPIVIPPTPQDDEPSPRSSTNFSEEESSTITPIENDPQPEQALPVQKQRTVMSQVLQMRLSSPLSPSQTDYAEDTTSEKDDRESIHIMLRTTPIDEKKPRTMQHLLWNSESPGMNCEDDEIPNWNSTSSFRDMQTQDRERTSPMERIAENTPPLPENPDSSTFPSSIGNRTTQPWSPSMFSIPGTGRTTLDSDAYSTINRVLDHYHEQSIVSPDMLNDLGEQILTNSPELARQGGWDPKKVTQLYLQELARVRFNEHAALQELPKLQTRHVPRFTIPGMGSPNEVETPVTDLESGDSDDNERGFELSGRGWISNEPGLEVPTSGSNFNRASLNCREDWIDASPSIADWMQTRALDSPLTEKSGLEYPPLPPPKDALRPAVPPKMPLPSEQVYPNRSSARTPRLSTDSRPQLPELDIIGEGLGVVLPDDVTELSSTVVPPPLPNHSPPPPPLPLPIDDLIDPQSEELRSPPSPSVYSRNAHSSVFKYDGISPHPRSRTSGGSSIHQGISLQSGLYSTSSHSQERSSQDQLSKNIADLPANAVSPTLEQKRLVKRKHVIKELVDTEWSFCQDMTVTEEIYKGSADACSGITSEDIKVLFGNSDQIVRFTQGFRDVLKQAGKSVYVKSRSSGSLSKRGSVSTSNSGTTESRSTNWNDLTDDERDRKTFFGEAFGQHIAQMEKIYGDYLKNHDLASKRLEKLQAEPKIAIWLDQCRNHAQDLTTAWSLDSLLVKPMQRILKYPLLLEQLLELTPENHPDYTALDIAAREMTGASRRINDMKKRADLVQNVVGRKRKDSDVRAGLSKAFIRRTEKLRQQVGLSEMVEDQTYNAISEKFGSHFFQLQVVMRDVEMYTVDVQSFVERFNEYVKTLETVIDVGQSSYPEIESKWRKFGMSVREMSATALPEHVSIVRRTVVDPMTTLLKLHEGPQKLMQKRNKRMIDYARYKAIKDRSERPDKKTQDHGEQFIALNDTLKDELPKLFVLTGKLVEACLCNFVEIQSQWHIIWQEKIKSILDDHQIPKHVSEIYEQFSGDFAFTEAQILTLGICNGSMLADAVNLVNFLSPATTLNGEESVNSLKRPSTFGSVRPRTISVNSDVSPSLPAPDFQRHSGSFTFSPIVTTMPPLPTGPQQSNQPSAMGRMRANSAASRAPSTPEISSSRSLSYTPNSSHQSSRPNTNPGRSTEPSPALPRMSSDSPTATRPTSGSTFFSANQDQQQPRAPSPNTRFSGLFSSAMPMSDSPSTSRPPSQDGEERKAFNVLFPAASLHEFNIDRARREAGYPYLTYVAGEIFDVVGEKGELWLAKNQDDSTNQIGWIWNKHFREIR